MRRGRFTHYIIILFFVTTLAEAERVSNICPGSLLTIQTPENIRDKNKFLFGKIKYNRFFVGLNPLDMTALSIELDSKTASLDMKKGKLISPAVFKVNNYFVFGKLNWEFHILDKELKILDKISGKGKIPKKIIWPSGEIPEKIHADRSYYYVLMVSKGRKKLVFTTAPRSFVIFDTKTVRSKIPAKIVSNYRKMLASDKFQKLFSKLSDRISKNPLYRWHIVGYRTKKYPDVCDNLFRLRKHMIIRTRIPMDFISTYCGKANQESPESKYVQIVGTDRQSEVELPVVKETTDDILKIDGKEIPITGDGLFIFPKNKTGKYRIKLVLKTGETLEMKGTFKKNSLSLKEGQNVVEGIPILLKNGPRDLFCGSSKKKTSMLMAGPGVYFVSDSFSPANNGMHLFLFNIVYQKIVRSSIDIHSELTAIPTRFIGPEGSKQKLYHLTALLGYRFNFPSFTMKASLGGLAYVSNDGYHGEVGLAKLIISPAVSLGFSMNIISHRYELSDIIKGFPMVLGQKTSFGMENNLMLRYAIKKSIGLHVTYKKNFFTYENKTHKTFIIENIDALILGVGIKF